MNERSSPQPANWLKWMILALVALLIGSFLVFGGEIKQATIDWIVRSEQWLRDAVQERPIAAYATAFALYVLVAAFALPIAGILSLAYGWFFGFGPGTVLVSFASTIGATCSFLMSRYLLRDRVESRFGERIGKFREAIDREGAFYLFTLRLIPYAPFFVINVVMGLTRIGVWKFYWVSQIGMLPGTMVYLFAGSSIKSVEEISRTGIFTPRLLIAFTLLGVFPLFVKKLFAWFGKTPRGETPNENAAE